MGTQCDSIDISQLKAVVLGLNGKTQNSDLLLSATTSKWRTSDGVNARLTTELTTANQWGWTDGRRDNQAIDPQSDRGGSQSSLRAGTIQQEAQMISISQPELLSTIPDSSRTRMALPSSQLGGDTQPVSQATHEEFTTKVQQHVAASRSAGNIENAFGNTGGTCDSTSHSYHKGQIGHIDLLGAFEQPSIPDEEAHESLDEEDMEPATQLVDVRAEMYPESKRFRQPITPVPIGRKRNHSGQIISQPNTTPRLPLNPFAGQMGGLDGMMNPSQLFKATQAVSSPANDGLFSDGFSERPSPDVYIHQRPSTADSLSSPAKLPRSSMVRAVTEPQTTYISMKESQAERERLLQVQSLDVDLAGQELSDDGFESDESQLRRRNLRKKMIVETKRQFGGVTAQPWPAPVKRNKGRKARKGSSASPPEASEPVFISDDAPGEEARGSVTEDETEHEEEHHQLEMADVDELADDNKENICIQGVQIPMTISRINRGNSPAGPSQSSPLHRQLQSPASPLLFHQALHHGNNHNSTASTQATTHAFDAAQTVAIADSQSSQNLHKATDIPAQAGNRARGPRLSEDARMVIPQSQLSKATAQQENGATCVQIISSSPASLRLPDHSQVKPPSTSEIFMTHKIANRATSPAVTLSQNAVNGLPLSHVVGTSPTGPVNSRPLISPSQVSVGAGKPGTNVTARAEASTEEIPRSEATNVTSTSETEIQVQDDTDTLLLQRTCTTTTPIAFLEIVSAPIGAQVHTKAVASSVVTPFVNNSAEDGPNHLPNTLAVQQSEGSTPFETAQSHIDCSPFKSPKGNGRRRLATPSSSLPRTITEIATNPSPADAFGDVDFDMNLLTREDAEYQKIMDPDSPVQKRRRGYHGRVLQLARPEPNKVPPPPQFPIEEVGTVVQGEDVEPREFHGNRNDKDTEAYTGSKSSLMQNEPTVPTIIKSKASMAKTRRRGRPKKIYSGHEKRPSNMSEDARNGQNQKSAVSSESRNKDKIPPEADPQNSTMIAPNRVFAHFNGNCAAYYPARCIGIVGGEEPRYRIRFDDGTVDVISGYGIKRLELRPGDNIKIDQGGSRTNNYVVEGMKDLQQPTLASNPQTPTRGVRNKTSSTVELAHTDVHGYATILASLKQRKSIEGKATGSNQISVSIKDVYLTQTMWTNFKDRQYTHTTAQYHTLSRLQTPSERPSTPSTPSSRTRRIKTSGFAKSLNTSISARITMGLFENMVFAITNLDCAEDNERITHQIVSNGGRILEAGYDELFYIPDLELISTLNNDDSSFHPTQAATTLGFTCLIANGHCRRAKYIQALALGIPCLAPRWIQDCVTHQCILPWSAYLLPSGESAYLGGVVRSRVLQPYAADTATLSNLMENRPKLLDGESVLLIMSQKEEKTMKSHPLITHALGARKVSKAGSLEVAAKAVAEAEKRGERWDWVYSHDNEIMVEKRLFGVESRGKKRKRGRESGGVELGGDKGRTKVVGNEFVIQSLILGQLVDLD